MLPFTLKFVQTNIFGHKIIFQGKNFNVKKVKKNQTYDLS